jgi:hypothetical protein
MNVVSASHNVIWAAMATSNSKSDAFFRNSKMGRFCASCFPGSHIVRFQVGKANCIHINYECGILWHTSGPCSAYSIFWNCTCHQQVDDPLNPIPTCYLWEYWKVLFPIQIITSWFIIFRVTFRLNSLKLNPAYKKSRIENIKLLLEPDLPSNQLGSSSYTTATGHAQDNLLKIISGVWRTDSGHSFWVTPRDEWTWNIGTTKSIEICCPKNPTVSLTEV